ncbi:MAG: hypothetical protein FWE61_00860 [Micrococcales bacterium]|nr:hypothetical protein [Micrococcales bacterium]
MKSIRVRAIAAVGTILLAAPVLAACGSNRSFCDVVTDSKYADIDDVDADAMISALKDLRSAAPSDLKGDIDIMIDAVRVTKDIDTNDPAALAEVANKIDLEKIGAASARIDAKVKECEK